jgi:hypothetical protein
VKLPHNNACRFIALLLLQRGCTNLCLQSPARVRVIAGRSSAILVPTHSERSHTLLVSGPARTRARQKHHFNATRRHTLKPGADTILRHAAAQRSRQADVLQPRERAIADSGTD